MENSCPNERSSFLKKLARIPKQQRQVLIEKFLQQAIRAEGRMDLKKRLRKIHSQLQPTLAPVHPSSPRPAFRRWLGWAAAASIVLFFPFWWLSPSVSPQALVDEYYQAYELSLLVRDDDQNAVVWRATSLYQQKKYREAIPAFEKALNTHPQPQLYLGLGISYWKSGDLEKAKARFQQLHDLQDPLLNEQAIWYLGLLALQQNEQTQARRYLKMLSEKPGADHHLAAKEIVEQLK